MEFTDIETASLIDALRHVESHRGLTDVEHCLLDKFCDELNLRGYSFDDTDAGLLSHKVIDEQTKTEKV